MGLRPSSVVFGCDVHDNLHLPTTRGQTSAEQFEGSEVHVQDGRGAMWSQGLVQTRRGAQDGCSPAQSEETLWPQVMGMFEIKFDFC